MKKFTYILIFLMALLLAACANETGPEFNSATDPTDASTAPTVTTDPTVVLTPNNIATNANLIPGDTYDVWAFQKYFNESPWYNRALSCSFGYSGAISMEHFFRNGLAKENMQDNTAFTNEERAYLHSKWCEKYGATPWVDAVKMPVKKLNEALAVLNMTVKDVKLPEDWVYYDKTDSYYAHIVKTDPISVKDIVVTKVVRNGSTVQVYWMTNEPYQNTATGEVFAYGVKMITKLKAVSLDGYSGQRYVIVSNIPGAYTPLTFAELNTPEDFAEFIRQDYWCDCALGCTFEKPEDISLEFYLYNGIHTQERQNPNTFTDDEKAFLNSEWSNYYDEEPWTSAIKMPVAKINEALTILGVTIDQLEIPNRWVYYDKTDSYYVWRRDAFGVGNVSVTKVEKGANGIVSVYWETPMIHHNTATGETWLDGVKMVMTMQGAPDGGYRILSNLPVQ